MSYPSSPSILLSDVESDDYSESARSYELGKASDFACARPRPDFSAFLCLWRKLTIGWEMRPVRLVLQNIRNFFSQNGWCLPFTKNSRSCKGSNKAESAGAKGQRKAWGGFSRPIPRTLTTDRVPQSLSACVYSNKVVEFQQGFSNPTILKMRLTYLTKFNNFSRIGGFTCF